MPVGSQAVPSDAPEAAEAELIVEHHKARFGISVFVPAAVGPAPILALDLHSSHGNAISQAACSGLDAYAERHGFVVARPEGVIDADIPNLERLWLWNVPGVPTTTGLYPSAQSRDDVAFLTDVIDAAAARFGTSTRAALVGMSGGARMASAYAAARPDRVLALAAVAGLRADGVDHDDPAIDGSDRQPVPVLAVHGDADDTNPWDGGAGPRWSSSLPAAVDGWVEHNGCLRPGIESSYADRVTRIAFSGGDPRRTVTLYRVDGGGHSWPGSDDAEAFAGLETSALVAEFFAAHAGD